MHNETSRRLTDTEAGAVVERRVVERADARGVAGAVDAANLDGGVASSKDVDEAIRQGIIRGADELEVRPHTPCCQQYRFRCQ